MPYEFKLQKLLDIRIENEEKSKINFKQAQYQKISVEKRLISLQNNFLKYSAERSTDIIQEKLRHIYLNIVSENIDKTKIELKQKNITLEEKRNELEKSQVDRKTVEVLKDKKLQAYLKEQNHIEQNTNDELALYAYIRNTDKSI